MSDPIIIELLRRIEALERRLGDQVGAEVGVPSASNLTSGTLADARLSSNVPLLNALNTFSANQSVSKNTNEPTLLFVVNTSAGAAAIARMFFGNNATNRDLVFTGYGSGYSGNNLFGAPGASTGEIITNDNLTALYIGTRGSAPLWLGTSSTPRMFVPAGGLRTSPASPATGEIYRDSSGFLKIG